MQCACSDVALHCPKAGLRLGLPRPATATEGGSLVILAEKSLVSSEHVLCGGCWYCQLFIHLWIKLQNMVLSGSTPLCVWKRQARDHSAYMLMDFLGKDAKDRGVVISGEDSPTSLSVRREAAQGDSSPAPSQLCAIFPCVPPPRVWGCTDLPTPQHLGAHPPHTHPSLAPPEAVAHHLQRGPFLWSRCAPGVHLSPSPLL